MKRLWVLLFFVFFAGCTTTYTLKTDDGVKIAYKFIDGGSRGIILLHGLGGDMTDWEGLTSYLKKEGFTLVLIDFRGHGESEGNWETFNTLDFLNFTNDARLAEKLLVTEGARAYAVIGANIGANVAITLANEKYIPKVIMLSPSYSYKGIRIENEIKNTNAQILVFSGRDDALSYPASNFIKREANATLILVSGKKHGTEMIPQINLQILNFLK